MMAAGRCSAVQCSASGTCARMSALEVHAGGIVCRPQTSARGRRAATALRVGTRPRRCWTTVADRRVLLGLRSKPTNAKAVSKVFDNSFAIGLSRAVAHRQVISRPAISLCACTVEPRRMTLITIAGRPLVPGEDPLSGENGNLDSWQPVTAVDERDVRSADSWIPRHPDLIRLTGKHPFNSEPPHDDVMKEGWLTPVSKHFVRNHGAVPRLRWESHKVRITGLVNKPLELGMDELTKLPAVTIPVLLSCCGNRRKEVNMLKNSQGFSWGPGAVSVNHWTGARLRDVLQAAGVKSSEESAKCVCTAACQLTRCLCAARALSVHALALSSRCVASNGTAHSGLGGLAAPLPQASPTTPHGHGSLSTYRALQCCAKIPATRR
jgi:Oxidoreductase molybdopterin binding domain